MRPPRQPILLLLSPEVDTDFTTPVDLASWLHSEMIHPPTNGHWAHRRATTEITTSVPPLSHSNDVLCTLGLWRTTVKCPFDGKHYNSSCWAVNGLCRLWVGEMWRVSYNLCTAVQRPASAMSLGHHGLQCRFTQETQGNILSLPNSLCIIAVPGASDNVFCLWVHMIEPVFVITDKLCYFICPLYVSLVE